ncbi:MAG TPA: hypothetical protein VLV55_00260 [Rhizomicrobium sp.]|nr:hypothetical protein [Rhizomicrobium sp.]
MPSFRLYLRDRGTRIVGRSDFEADDETSALKISRRIAEACSDSCADYDLWRDTRKISSAAAATGDGGTDLTESERRVVIDAEIALHDSAWAIRNSKHLKSCLEGLKPR